MQTHQQIDARSLDWHRLVVDRIRANPALFSNVLATIEHLKRMVSPSALSLVLEWDRLAQAGVDRCLAMAVEDSERGRQMRQSAPFAGIIPPREREAFFRRWAADHAT